MRHSFEDRMLGITHPHTPDNCEPFICEACWKLFIDDRRMVNCCQCDGVHNTTL